MGILGQVWLLFSILCVLSLLFFIVKTKDFLLNTKLKLNIGAFVGTMIVNYATASGLISGLSQSEISQRYQTMITPAGFAFSIWGVIYGLLILSMIYWIWKKNDEDKQQLIHKLSPLIWAMFAVNIAWNIFFSMSMIAVSVICILAYWVILFLICRKIGNKISLTTMAYGIHFGWISVASIVNFFALLVQINNGELSSPELWYVLALIFGIILGFTLVILLGNVGIPLAMAWAYFGIFMRLNDTKPDSLLVSMIALTGIVSLIALTIGAFVGVHWGHLFQKIFFKQK